MGLIGFGIDRNEGICIDPTVWVLAVMVGDDTPLGTVRFIGTLEGRK